MSKRDEEIREILRELDVLVEKARANVAALTALLAAEMDTQGEGPEIEP